MMVEPGTILWAMLAHIAFGMQNFLIGYSNTLPLDGVACCAVLWMASGVVGVIVGVFFLRSHGSFFFQDVGCEGAPLSVKVKLVTIGGSLCVGFAQFLMKKSFALAPRNTGPLCAVISSDVIVISIFCHFVYWELMNKWQIGCVGAIVSGLVVMALGSGGEGGVVSIDDDTAVEYPLWALLFSMLGMFSFAAGVLCIRAGFTENIAAWSSFISRMTVIGLLGLGTYICATPASGSPDATLLMWCVPVVTGVLQAAGVFGIIKALQFKNTGIANAIFASNSVLVMILQVVVLQQVPHWLALLGMVIVIGAVVTIALSQDAPSAGDMAPLTCSGGLIVTSRSYSSC